jgi:hypothetical protein
VVRSRSKAILPYVSSIAAALPAPRESDEAAAARAGPAAAIAELQSAASQNAVHIKELAGQLQKTVAALGQGAPLADARFRWIVALCIGAIIVSCIALGVSVIALFGR